MALLVVELKARAADRRALEQLQAGLELLSRYLPTVSASVQPQAYLVASKLTAHFQRLLGGRSPLRYGHRQVPLKIKKCGQSVEV